MVRDDSGLRGSGPGRGIDKEWNKTAGRPLGHSSSGALASMVAEKDVPDETFPTRS